MALDLGAVKKPAVKKEEISGRSEQIKNFVQDAASQEPMKKPRRRPAVKRKMCSFMIPENLLADLDRLCEKKAQTRSGVINLAIVKILEDGL